MDKTYQVLLLDLDNTLFDFEKTEKIALISTAKHFGLADDYDLFEKTYHEVNKPLWQKIENGEMTGDVVKIERFIQLVNRMGLSCDPLVMSGYYIQRLGEGIEMFPYASEVCEMLSKDYKLVAVTNGIKDVQENRMRRSGLLKYFEEVIISEDVGYSKPNPKIFEIAMQKIGHIDKNTVLMIGDSLKVDIQGAHAAGFDTCWVNILGHASPEVPLHKWEIRKLEQLLNYL
jgi:YjjG family noncanonical pyrimidine nucleotidase